jgi:Ca2+-binding RTX toxin-like protein
MLKGIGMSDLGKHPGVTDHFGEAGGLFDALAAAHLVLGGRGSETLSGGTGNDIIFGGAGNDTIYGDGVSPPTGINGDAPPGNNLIFGGPGDDVVFAGYGADTVLGGSGNDLIYGAGAATGGAGFINALRGDGADLLFGGAGNDTIDGSGGRDTIFGGAGDDVLRGSYDADVLTGGLGRDTFVFRLLPSENAPFSNIPDTGVGEGNRDVVTDFRHGKDILDLSGYRNPAGGAETPIFLGTDAFVGSFALQVRYELLADGNTLIQFAGLIGRPGNAPPVPPAPSEPVGEIELVGVHHLTASDFIL